ncbi:tRNA (N6-threonylcarbamoyladenosine(37)-N6)-methyltransferase TrmO [Paraphotobacterium marinum]|uniref:tRNA (N6-threonylcarbamoyladenosine(37)-N6)-methyltransferase TrmO n=1 Tax=Paraphotobacterium marinum TaxID=1755811 RepID=A0A220VBN6_9GAMM|nr:tRNA (N6-threonylcarbamoyladenosine(37)-N6)-methyltransferase TrmO [Paraphotobacterium marinum]ASK77808.1 tRNA (N6-threonylcarbamoyladenosine(37)-N6)-methyltransferase TrmO [Paraphotobacterium marinum]
MYTVEPIGRIISPFKEKFATPRQPGLLTSVQSQIILNTNFSKNAVRDLDKFSHLWILFLFSECINKKKKELIRPPRLGGNKKTGVFATRSNFRPNNIGLSSVILNKVEINKNNVSIFVQGADLIDNTPIIDIKPYIKYSDSHEDAISGYAQEAPLRKKVFFFKNAWNKQIPKNHKELIQEILSYDPRPGYKRDDNKEYHVKILHYDIGFYVLKSEIFISKIILLI